MKRKHIPIEKNFPFQTVCSLLYKRFIRRKLLELPAQVREINNLLSTKKQEAV